MSIIWDRRDSKAFQRALSSDLDIWDHALDQWESRVQSVADKLGSGPGAELSGAAYNAAKTLFLERVLPLVQSAHRCCRWTRQDLAEYAAAEFPLLDSASRLDEALLQQAIDETEDTVRRLTAWWTDILWAAPWEKLKLDRSVAALRLSISQLNNQLNALRAFAQRTRGIFNDEIRLTASLAAGVQSLGSGSLTADGVYAPPSGDYEAWLGQVDAYLEGHPATVDTDAIVQVMLAQLRAAGLLTGDVGDTYLEWLGNAASQGISPATICAIAAEFDITPQSFAVLDGLDRISDPDKKTFFVLPPNVDAAIAEQIVLMAYVFNARTDYAKADDPGNEQDTSVTPNSYLEVPYSVAEILRIQQRIDANADSYPLLLPWIQNLGGQVVATPNGMMMGVAMGGYSDDSWWLRFCKAELAELSQGGGTTYGDLFIINIDDSTDPLATIKTIIKNGSAPYTGDPTGNSRGYFPGPQPGDAPGTIDLDRLLHHEQRHAQQWADNGLEFIHKYFFQVGTGRGDENNPWEQDAGLTDGGYPPPK